MRVVKQKSGIITLELDKYDIKFILEALERAYPIDGFTQDWAYIVKSIRE
ncbi:hypothetical protein LCGC14_1464450 [marine sediment metagenome]|uniref:Uncharacterized protein n=1 Tax=marine sediment metagenome TaxID=412755 RepID=A0A0F9K037_9ZZZZ